MKRLAPVQSGSLGSVLDILGHKTERDQANRRQEKPEKCEAEAGCFENARCLRMQHV